MVSVNTYGQCTANAGNDTTLCVSFGLGTFYLGGSPTTTGGTPPFTYTWSCTYEYIISTLTASNFLDDTTAANPQLIYHNEDTVAFYLTITDGLGNTCSDTIVIQFCLYGSTLEDKQAYINQGDTIQLYPSVAQGCSPLQYEWTPNYNISDPNVPNPLAWPDTTTYYVATVTDFAGCQATDETFEVYVTPTGIRGQDSELIRVDIFPNPLHDHSTIKIYHPHSTDLSLNFYDALGRTVKQMIITETETEINRTDFNVGIYFYRLFDKNKTLGKGKLIIE